jgi:hypothetical protein
MMMSCPARAFSNALLLLSFRLTCQAARTTRAAPLAKIVEIIVAISEPVFSGSLPELVLGAAALLSVVVGKVLLEDDDDRAKVPVDGLRRAQGFVPSTQRDRLERGDRC